jgi:four helix bundle suffix protein
MAEALIPKHGGYRNLKSFQVAQLAYDVTVLFCERFVDRRSRTHDQMVQAARSGVQNIAEGSQASGTSRKMELKLTNVARASLEELRLDYEDFLRQRGLPNLEPNHPALARFRKRRCAKLEDVRAWVKEEMDRQRPAQVPGAMDEHTAQKAQGRTRTATDTRQEIQAAPKSVPVPVSPCQSKTTIPLSPETLAANAALSLLNLACHLLDRQLAALAEAFLQEGGFTERMHRLRSKRRP